MLCAMTTAPADPAAKRAPAMPADERRAAIIAAATPLLRKSGRRVTTREIADATGIAEGTIFRVFDTKADLIHAVVEQSLDVTDTVDDILAIDASLPLATRVQACATILGERIKKVFDIMMALHSRGPDEHSDGDEDHHNHGSRSRRGFDDHRQALLLGAVAAIFEPDAANLTCPPHRAAQLLSTLAFSGAHPMIAGREPFTADEIADVLLHGITRTES